MRLGLFLFLAAAAYGQRSEPPKTTFEEQPAYVLSNGALELTVLPKGSTFASVVLADDPEKLSPLWNPMRLAREVGEKNTFDSALGHFICVDGFGPVSPEEETAGLPGHGEAHQTPFAVKFYAKEAGATGFALASE